MPIDLNCQIRFVIDDLTKKQLDYLIKIYDDSVLDDERYIELYKLFTDSNQENWNTDLYNELNLIIREYSDIDYSFEEGIIYKDVDFIFEIDHIKAFHHFKNFLKDAFVDTYDSRDGTFLAFLELDLHKLITYNQIINDEILEMSSEFETFEFTYNITGK